MRSFPAYIREERQRDEPRKKVRSPQVIIHIFEPVLPCIKRQRLINECPNRGFPTIEPPVFNHEILLHGDLNRLSKPWQGNNYSLKQTVNLRREGIGTLDLVLINLHINLYIESIHRPPHGL